MAATVIAFESHEEMNQKALTLPDQARSITITDQPTYDLAAEKLLGVAELRREIVAHYAPLKASAFETHRKICGAEKTMLAPVEEAEAILKRGIGAYQTEQRQIQEQRDREARALAEQAAAEALEQSIEAAEKDGASVEEVAAIINQPAPVPVVRTAPVFTPVAGVSTAKTYKVEVYDLKALCNAVARGLVAENFVTANLVALNGVARSTRGSVRIAGCRVTEDVSVRAGRR